MKYRLLKPWLDLVIAELLLIGASPFMLLIALGIKLDSPGPIFFRQQRIGKDGKPFTLFKFRSMHDGVAPALHQEHVTRLIKENSFPVKGGRNESLKLKNDQRITKFGKILRASSLDELPQLINVLRREMSLVGPRPAISYEVNAYRNHHKRRLEVLPGITGLWQVKGRNQVSFDEMVQLDIQYIETMNLWLDITIMIRTPIEMIRGKGAG